MSTHTDMKQYDEKEEEEDNNKKKKREPINVGAVDMDDMNDGEEAFLNSFVKKTSMLCEDLSLPGQNDMSGDEGDESRRRRQYIDGGGGDMSSFEPVTFRKRHRQKLKERQSRFNKIRLTCGKIVNNEIVQIGMIVLIIINAMIMGIATFDFVTDDPSTELLFSNIDRGFLVIYTVELVFQLIYFGWRLVQDAWLVFDFLVVVSSWAFDFQDAGSQFQIVRAFRIFRAFRLITRIKVLRDLVAAIGEVIPRMTAIGMLLILIFYIFAVLFTELFKDLELTDTYFTTLDASLFTCYEMMTLEWAGIAREVMGQRSWAWAPFLAFVAITGFMVFNLIIAVICDAVAIIDKIAREREAKARGEVIETAQEKLIHAQERMDTMAGRIDAMLLTQKSMQDLVEVLAAELYRLDGSLSMSPDDDQNDQDDANQQQVQNRRTKHRRTTSTSTGGVSGGGSGGGGGGKNDDPI